MILEQSASFGRLSAVASIIFVICVRTHSPHNRKLFLIFSARFSIFIFQWVSKHRVESQIIRWRQCQCELGFDFDGLLMPFGVSIAFYWHILMMISFSDCERRAVVPGSGTAVLPEESMIPRQTKTKEKKTHFTLAALSLSPHLSIPFRAG